VEELFAPDARIGAREPECAAFPQPPDRHGVGHAVAAQGGDDAHVRLPQEVVELDDASNIAVFEVTVQPGAMFPWHTHPGMSIGMITQGEFVYIYAEDCVERSYPAGTAFVDPGFDNVHMALNPHAEEETVIIATAFGVPDEGPYTIPIDEDEAAILDEQCGIEREGAPS
jgi:quercetin dioxygenase-like cupin family protein